MTVTNTLGVGAAGGTLSIFPCFRAANAPAGTQATFAGAASTQVLASPSTRQMYSLNYVYRPSVSNVPTNQAIWIGMCTYGAAANVNWDSLAYGFISALIFQ